MKDKTIQSVNIEESEASKEEKDQKLTFLKRFTCVNIL